MSTAAQALAAAEPQPVTGARLVVEALEREGRLGSRDWVEI